MGGREPHRLFVAVVDYCRLTLLAAEDHFLGETIFRVGGRAFAFLGRPERAAVTVRPPPAELVRLLGHPNVRRARYIGRFGWLTVDMDDDESLRLALALVDAAYRFAGRGPAARADDG